MVQARSTLKYSWTVFILILITVCSGLYLELAKYSKHRLSAYTDSTLDNAAYEGKHLIKKKKYLIKIHTIIKNYSYHDRVHDYSHELSSWRVHFHPLSEVHTPLLVHI